MGLKFIPVSYLYLGFFPCILKNSALKLGEYPTCAVPPLTPATFIVSLEKGKKNKGGKEKKY